MFDFSLTGNKTVFRKRLLNSTVTPPEHYRVNVTIRECCFGFMTQGKLCIPVCQNICINSFCVGNNQCQCNSGYYPVDNFRCLPKCDPPCGDNMACLGPNKCLCKPEYKRTNDSYCEPICSFTTDNFECINAKCVSPGVCECLDGYRRISEFQCEPICSSCLNGDCVSPEVCECLEGYENNSEGVCEPICDPNCVNAKCVSPNQCKCDKGFEKYLKSHECLENHIIKDRESCLKSCQHGTCSDHGCICDSGYEMYNGKCLKVCTKECENGKCLEDQCVCPKNYKLSENSTSCLPICAFEDEHDCIEGTCVAPQTCKCFDGYRFLDARNCTCVPMCSPQCINGVCTEDGCICHENFYNISDYECIKNCSEGYKWIYDECIEESTFDSFETDDGEEISHDKSTTETFTSFESSTDDDNEDDDEGSAEIFTAQSTERFVAALMFQICSSHLLIDFREEIMMKKSVLPQLVPMTLSIVVLSTILILIVLILITFCVLYRRINPKNIYHVNEKGKNTSLNIDQTFIRCFRNIIELRLLR